MDVEKFEQSLLEKIKDTIHFLEEEWFQISLPENHRIKRKLAVYDNICDLCDKILADERSMKERILRRIQDNKMELMQLCQDLDISFEEPKNLNLLEVDNYLQNKITKLKEEKEYRFTELKDLIEKDQCICSYLGETPCYISIHLLPSAEDLIMVQNHIQEMEEEKKKRRETYKNLRKDIVSFVEQLEKQLEAELLLDVVCNSEQETSLTKDYLLDVRKLHSELEFESKELESQSLELREKISSLWNLLHVSPDTEEAFLATVPSHTPSCIAKLENHLAELKELRLQNLGHFIEDLRTELDKWWDRCYVGESHKNVFTSLPLAELTEEVLEAYELEVSEWRKYYSNHSYILDKVDYFLALFDNMQQLEEKAKDPSRLFNTRGGALLQEEKERKRVKLELPQVQEQLINLCSEYEAANGHPFIIDGSSVQEYLGKLWEYHDIQREKEKSDRLQNKNKPLTTLKMVRNLKRTPNIITSGVGSRKRGREADDDGGKMDSKMIVSNHPPVCGVSMFRSQTEGQQNAIMGPSYVPSAKALVERNRLVPPLKQPHCDDSTVLHDSTSYDNFKAVLQRLNSNEVIHSSILYPESADFKKRKRQRSAEETCRYSNIEREAYLKGTLNLISPLKMKNPSNLVNPRRTSIQGGASAGAFLVRSSSQPSLKKSPNSPAKMSVRTNQLWLI